MVLGFDNLLFCHRSTFLTPCFPALGARLWLVRSQPLLLPSPRSQPLPGYSEATNQELTGSRLKSMVSRVKI